MEHRCSMRKPIEFQLLLYRQGLPVQNAASSNIGLGGMFIDTGACLWRKNEYLEVEILGCNGKPGVKLPAVVVQHSRQGTGVAFDAISSEQRRTLRARLYDGSPENALQPHSCAVA